LSFMALVAREKMRRDKAGPVHIGSGQAAPDQAGPNQNGPEKAGERA
jgi:hypothetical protein